MDRPLIYQLVSVVQFNYDRLCSSPLEKGLFSWLVSPTTLIAIVINITTVNAGTSTRSPIDITIATAAVNSRYAIHLDTLLY